jgi:hypothetical protein
LNAVQDYRDNLPLMVCKNCGYKDFTIQRKRLRLFMQEGHVVINQLECARCGEVVTILP